MNFHVGTWVVYSRNQGPLYGPLDTSTISLGLLYSKSEAKPTMDDEELDLDIQPEPLPSASDFDDGELSREDLTRPQVGYPISDEEYREEQVQVYREGGKPR